MDQRSIVFCPHLNGPSAHVIHDDLVATFDPKAVSYNIVTRYLREAKLGTAEVTLDHGASSPCLDNSGRAILAVLEEKKRRVHPRETWPEPSLSQGPPSMERLPNRSDSYDRFLADYRPVC
jgi:hypothetical protein